MNILFYIFSLLYYVLFVNTTLYLMNYYPGSGCPRCKGVDFQIIYIYMNFSYVSRFVSLMKLFFFDGRCFRRGSHHYTCFFNSLYSFTFLVWDGLNNAFDYWPIVVDDTCKYGVFEKVRIVKFFNPFVTQRKSVVYLDKIWRDMH